MRWEKEAGTQFPIGAVCKKISKRTAEWRGGEIFFPQARICEEPALGVETVKLFAHCSMLFWILSVASLFWGCSQGSSSKTSQPTRWEEPAPARTVAAGGGGTTASGLEYQVLRAGTGSKPTRQDTVKVHYHGYLVDGTVFDSSVQRGQPAVFGLTQVIPGWTEGLQLMPEGSKFRFRIPPHLGYGERGSPPKIGPNQTLMFEVELLEIVGS